MENTENRHGQKIVITVGKKPHGPVATAPEPSKSEADPKAGEEAVRDRLALVASLYRILRG